LFAESIKTVVDNVEGGIGGVIMGVDGIAIDKYIADKAVDVDTISMEFSYILNQVRKAGHVLEIGELTEFSVRAEQLSFVVRMLSEEFFIAVVLTDDGNYGKARYMLRLVAPQVIANL
jgi:predicted regulator of Ras-like GTPase activity (Roadblock/LC7/MglB family)